MRRTTIFGWLGTLALVAMSIADAKGQRSIAEGTRSLLKNAHDQIRKTRDAVQDARPTERVESDSAAGNGSGAAAAAGPAAPRHALDRTRPWAAACEVDAENRVKEHRPNAEKVVFTADGATQSEESTDATHVEGKGEFLGFGAWNPFSYRCRYDVQQSKVTWGRVTIGR